MEWEVIEILSFGCFWLNEILCPLSGLVVLKTPRLWAPCLADMLVKLHVKLEVLAHSRTLKIKLKSAQLHAENRPNLDMVTLDTGIF